MKVDRTPFTIFDFIGYFIPGFLFLYIFYLTFQVDFHSILTLEKKTSHSFEYVVFGVFVFIFAWFAGHLLSRISHFLQDIAKNIFEDDSNKLIYKLLDPFGTGKKSIFSHIKQSTYEKLLNDILKKMSIKTGIPPSYLLKVNVPGFLKITSYYINPDKFSIIYNYLVIQGAFRAFTFSFLIHATLLCVGRFYNIHLENWVKLNFYYIFGSEIISALICWNIYIKYYRRLIEENVVYLIYELYINKESK